MPPLPSMLPLASQFILAFLQSALSMGVGVRRVKNRQRVAKPCSGYWCGIRAAEHDGAKNVSHPLPQNTRTAPRGAVFLFSQLASLKRN